MKGIILAGGKGTRLYPMTSVVCKQLLPIFDKPMVYYPLSILMLAGIFEILIISTKEDIPRFQRLFKKSGELGLHIEFAVQERPEGLAQAFIIGQSFIKDDNVCLILGDNLFYGHNLPILLKDCRNLEKGSIIFGYHVSNPNRYGVIAFDAEKKPVKIVEKPKNFVSEYAVPGLYFYDNEVIEIAKTLSPSSRNELEITDINNIYLQRKELTVRLFGRGFAWLDTGTFDAFYKACAFVQAIEERQGIKIGCIEEIAYRMGRISLESLEKYTDTLFDNEYKKYLQSLIKQEKTAKNLLLSPTL
jgi:glucose-1-phosphate thymidylyltransferase